MAHLDHKYPTMTLYVDRNNPITHWITMMLMEKAVVPNIVFVDPNKIPDELSSINPHGALPFLVDQAGLMLYTPHIIVEYLEERFPHPPLLPVYPITRAKYRQVVYQIAQNWYGLLQQIEDGENSKGATQLLQQGFAQITPLLKVKPYFLSEEFTIVDCCIAPILARLDQLQVSILGDSDILMAYKRRLLTRQTYQDSVQRLT